MYERIEALTDERGAFVIESTITRWDVRGREQETIWEGGGQRIERVYTYDAQTGDLTVSTVRVWRLYSDPGGPVRRELLRETHFNHRYGPQRMDRDTRFDRNPQGELLGRTEYEYRYRDNTNEPYRVTGTNYDAQGNQIGDVQEFDSRGLPPRRDLPAPGGGGQASLPLRRPEVPASESGSTAAGGALALQAVVPGPSVSVAQGEIVVAGECYDAQGNPVAPTAVGQPTAVAGSLEVPPARRTETTGEAPPAEQRANEASLPSPGVAAAWV
jgi:hypothetical protein